MNDIPRSRWHSFDRHPWLHPWLIRDNLVAFRDFSKGIREEAAYVAEKQKTSTIRTAFVGNLANSSYQRISALRQVGFNSSLYLHPGDTYPISQPEWEEFDGDWPTGLKTIQEIKDSGIVIPEVSDVHRLSVAQASPTAPPSFCREDDFRQWPEYFGYLPILNALQDKDSLFTLQAPYLAYLSGRPYFSCHIGGDIWYECSRGDSLGALQRKAFACASPLTITNPWSLAFARRYGFLNMVLLPMILNTKAYCPGEPKWRKEWKDRIGGDFFVLSTARLDERYKGSSVGIEGFLRFAATHPGARLILLGWGDDHSSLREKALSANVADRVLFLAPCGKKRLIQYLRSADCLLDQFVLGYFGLTALEAMSVGLPVIMRLETDQYNAFLDTGSPPVLNASSSEMVTEALTQLADMQGYAQEVGVKELEWFARSASPQSWGNVYRDFFISAAIGHKFDFSKSPLAAPLGSDELEYHKQELANAPEFPNYH